MSLQQFEATQRATLIEHDRERHHRPARQTTPGAATVALVTAAVAILPAAFWASIAWLVWGWLAAAIVTIVVLIVSVLTMGLLRTAGETESPEATPSRPALRRVA